MVCEETAEPGPQQGIEPPEYTETEDTTRHFRGETLIARQENRSFPPSFSRQYHKFDCSRREQESDNDACTVESP